MLILSALGSTGTLAVVLGVAAEHPDGLAPAAVARLAPWPVVLFLATLIAAFLVVLVVWPEVPALAAIGPRPDGGGRFYGITNSLETLLLLPTLVPAAVLGSAGLVAVGLLALVTVGWSRAGADGGGVIVSLTGLAVLAARVAPGRASRPGGWPSGPPLWLPSRRCWPGSTPSPAAPATSRVHSAGGRPRSPATSATGFTSRGLARPRPGARSSSAWLARLSWLAILVLRRPRTPLLEAFGAAILVSMLVNDSPRDVSLFGFAACAALWSWERARLPGRV